MSRDEAIEWIKGTKSTCNMISPHPIETFEERVARADAAMIEQSYWVLRAHQDIEYFRPQVTKSAK